MNVTSSHPAQDRASHRIIICHYWWNLIIWNLLLGSEAFELCHENINIILELSSGYDPIRCGFSLLKQSLWMKIEHISRLSLVSCEQHNCQHWPTTDPLTPPLSSLRLMASLIMFPHRGKSKLPYALLALAGLGPAVASLTLGLQRWFGQIMFLFFPRWV